MTGQTSPLPPSGTPSDRPTVAVLTSSLWLQCEINPGLVSAGLQVVSFTNPLDAQRYLSYREAWRRVSAPPIALVLEIDFVAPDAALALVKEIRNAAYQRLRDLPILALTRHAQVGDHQKAEEAGISLAFFYPFRLNSLLETLASYLPKSHGQRDGREPPFMRPLWKR